ncbi:MAG TPA: hypothetical protein VIA62_30150 [Thermoanaerobaculia bacterium]|jgi:predicted metalloprotease with PDZ domain|nr:hypothetical protein [Thermoanaerobaculia bacterium]
MTKPIPILGLSLALTAAGLQGAEMPEPISYTLRFPAPQTHYVEVEALVPADGQPAIELRMAVWTPGSYLIREYSRNVEALAATTESGAVLAAEKTSKNRWRIETHGVPRVVVRYRVYSREMSVRSNFVDAGFALVNGAPTFLTRAGAEGRPHDVRVIPPPDWKVVESPLPASSGSDAGGPGGHYAFRAASFDVLVDSPLYAGNAAVHPFEAGGRPVRLVTEGEDPAVWDGPRSAADAAKIFDAQIAFWGGAPFPRYVVFNLLTETGGGLEHRDSCTLMSSRWRARTREGYIDWLGLVSHELFHAWNGKRLRPVELGPFDFETENYTRSLWVVEGVTSYYGDLLVHRAGFSTRKEYLKGLSKTIENLQTAPARKVQPLDEASFDAWIKFYRQDENAANTSTSYYTKGDVVAFLLDTRIRHATAGRKSLDDAMRLALQRYSGERGYRPEELRQTFEEVAGVDLGGWLARAVDTTAELDYREALDWYGLRFVESDGEKEDKAEKKDANAAELPAAWLGAETEVQGGRLMVTVVKRETPAYEAVSTSATRSSPSATIAYPRTAWRLA